MLRKQKKFILFLLFILLSVVLTGCLGAEIVLEVSPDPIIFSLDETEQEVTVTATSSGFGEIRIDDITLLVYEPENEEDYEYKESIVVNESIPFSVSGLSVEETRKIDLEDIFAEDEYGDFEKYYEEKLVGETFIFQAIIDGSVNTSKSVEVIFE